MIKKERNTDYKTGKKKKEQLKANKLKLDNFIHYLKKRNKYKYSKVTN
jgi:hypothetical protein